nr:MAG TPA: hypothetical protein [Caudoviricetes sp.]
MKLPLAPSIDILSFYFSIGHLETCFCLSTPLRHSSFSISQQFKGIHALYYHNTGL